MRWEWILSAAVHALMLLGAALVVNGWTVGLGGTEGRPEFSCAVQPPGLNLTLPPPIPDRRVEKPPSADAAPSSQALGRESPWGEESSPSDRCVIYYAEGDTFCGTCIAEINEECQGRVKWIFVPAPPPVPGAYASWRASRRNNRPLLPRPGPEVRR